MLRGAVASGRSRVSGLFREVSVGLRTLRLRSRVSWVEPSRTHASAPRSRRDLRAGRCASAPPLPGWLPPEEIRSAETFESHVPARTRSALARCRVRFQPEVRLRSTLQRRFLALQLSFGNAAIELGDGQALLSPGANTAGWMKVWFSKPQGRRLHERRQASRRRRKPSRS